MDCLFCQHKHFIWSFSPFYASQIWSLGGARRRRPGETVSREITKSSKCLQSSSKLLRRKSFLFLCNQQMVEVTRGWYLHPTVTPQSTWVPLYTRARNETSRSLHNPGEGPSPGWKHRSTCTFTFKILLIKTLATVRRCKIGTLT